MATFTPPTYEQPVKNRLGQYGLSFTVGKVVYICTNDDAFETTMIKGAFDQQLCPDGHNIASGSGDAGYALFRRGLTYTVTAGEGTILTGAGYTVT